MLTRAQELAHPHSLAFALNTAALLCIFRREGRAAHLRVQAAMILSTEHGFTQWVAVSTIIGGKALAEQGELAEGIAQMRQGIAAWRATGAEVLVPCFLTLLAEAYKAIGQAEEGLRLLEDALTAATNTGECWYEAELHRLTGELYLRQTRPNAHDAERCFHQALTLARQQQTKSLELRATMSLARLWRGQGQRAAARERLAEVYGWFTEGFETTDLREAQALLEELTSDDHALSTACSKDS